MVKVAIIGCGNLGSKIAGELAYYGHEVRVFDQNTDALDRLKPRLTEDRKMLKEDGLLVQSNFVGEVFSLSRLEDAVKGAEFILEVIAEDLTAKQDIFERISHCCKKDAVIGTSAMVLGVDDIIERTLYKERCLGIRFLYPVYCIPEVEVVPGESTSVQTLKKVLDLLERMGKTAFFRSTSEPLVLSEEQRETRRLAHMQHVRQSKLIRGRPTFGVPDLANKVGISTALNSTYDSTSVSNSGMGEKDCVVCMDEDRNCVLHPCHHLCTCFSCGRLLLKRQDACPICRKPIASIFRIFHS